jgi:hypothetical protein
MKYIISLLTLCFCTSSYAEVKTYNLTLKDRSFTIQLDQPNSYILTRLPGPIHYGPDGTCLMCLGNHLLGGHGITYEYLMKIGYSQWQTLHDNLHNDPNFKGHIGYDAQIIGYGNSGSYSRGFRRGR